MEAEDFIVTTKDTAKMINNDNDIQFSTMSEVENEAVKRQNGQIYSVYLKDNAPGTSTGNNINNIYDHLRELAKSPQNNLAHTMEIIELCRQYANYDDIIGLVNECIENNVNTQLRCAYRGDNRDKTDPAKEVIDDFNDMIDMQSIISRVIPTAFRDGTCIFCLRKKKINKKIHYTVDFYPVGVAVISDYEVNCQPYVLIDINELKSRLSKMYPKNRKRKGLFFDNLEDEIRATYPIEVYTAYKNKEQWAKLPIECSGVVRVNNQNKQYGLSPIFRALWPTAMLDAFANADRSTAQARAKKIIVQTLHKEILGESYNRDSYAQQTYAHQNFMAGWKMPTVVVTTPATVEDIKYVEPKAETTNINLINYYRQKSMGTLGISFLAGDGSSSISVANISVKQLMKTVNKIAAQLESIIEKWYRVVLDDNHVKYDFDPIVEIEGAEILDLEIRKELADTLFTKLNCSFETAYSLYGFNYEDERNKRQAENDQKIEEIFTPRMTAYTASNNDSDNNGRPADKDSDDPDKQDYDNLRNRNT